MEPLACTAPCARGHSQTGTLQCVCRSLLRSSDLQISDRCLDEVSLGNWLGPLLGWLDLQNWQDLGKSGCMKNLREFSSQKGYRLEACHLLGGMFKEAPRGSEIELSLGRNFLSL